MRCAQTMRDSAAGGAIKDVSMCLAAKSCSSYHLVKRLTNEESTTLYRVFVWFFDTIERLGLTAEQDYASDGILGLRGAEQQGLDHNHSRQHSLCTDINIENSLA